MEINLPKGTHDVILDEARAYEKIETLFKAVADLYGFSELRTPIIEATELFTRSVGDSSDIVRKEMYTFKDKGDRSITLRPELTAGVMRSIVNNKLFATQDLPIKVYYLGPAFRYERPQLGRYRQFNQFGVESVGITSPLSDAEVIMMGYAALKMLGFGHITLKINTLGDDESRKAYRVALKEYFGKHLDKMCPDCHERYESNPLRILDCKVPEDIEIVKKAPKISDYLTEAAQESFEFVLATLANFDIKYEVDESLVRGLDYYSHVVFEFHYTTEAGVSLGALGAGGHYDNLVSELGGPALSGVGLAFGIERIYGVLENDKLLQDVKEETDFYVMPLGDNALLDAYMIAQALRGAGYRTEVCFENKGFKTLFKRAEHKGSKYAVIIGDTEMQAEQVTLKNLKTQEQITVKYADLIDKADQLFAVEDDHDHH
ncbi:MAG: histidine--tRNA ligase [Firmicutes bacterium]|nr:histidine--tRNA ligase [Bacillota bacterium]